MDISTMNLRCYDLRPGDVLFPRIDDNRYFDFVLITAVRGTLVTYVYSISGSALKQTTFNCVDGAGFLIEKWSIIGFLAPQNMCI